MPLLLGRANGTFGQNLPRAAVSLCQRTHVAAFKLIQESDHRPDVLLHLSLLGPPIGIPLTQRPKDPELLDFARQCQEFFDGRVLDNEQKKKQRTR